MALLNTIAEGGQTWAHRVRMLRQVLKIALYVAVLAMLMVFGTKMARMHPTVYVGTWYYVKAEVLKAFQNEVSVNRHRWRQIDPYQTAPSSGRVSSQRVSAVGKRYSDYLWQQALHHLIVAVFWGLGSFAAMLGFFLVRGNLSKRTDHISGTKVTSAKRLAWKLRLARKASPINLGPLPLLKGCETQHTLVTGGTGSGKTNCFHTLLPQIRAAGQRAVIVDVTGAFVERYYQSGDVLLNPFDNRGVPWHPWVECRDRFDRDSLAESLIPTSYSDREIYWRNAARAFFTSIVEKTQDLQRTSDLIRWLLYEPLTQVCEFVQGTKAASFLDLNAEKTAGSIRSVAASFLTCLEHLQDTKEPFCIRDWTHSPDSQSWLFLYSKPSQRSSLNPLLTCWLSLAIRGLLHMEPDLDRRLWFVIDELPSLNKIKDLETLLSEGRKYGGCGLLALQSPAQLEAIYSREGAQTITGNCATKVVFAERNPEVAEQISRIFGNQEIEEYQEGISYGAHEMRDGVSLSKVKRRIPVVSPFEIQSLLSNEAFVRLPENIPVTKLTLSIAQHG